MAEKDEKRAPRRRGWLGLVVLLLGAMVWFVRSRRAAADASAESWLNVHPGPRMQPRSAAHDAPAAARAVQPLPAPSQAEGECAPPATTSASGPSPLARPDAVPAPVGEPPQQATPPASAPSDAAAADPVSSGSADPVDPLPEASARHSSDLEAADSLFGPPMSPPDETPTETLPTVSPLAPAQPSGEEPNSLFTPARPPGSTRRADRPSPSPSPRRRKPTPSPAKLPPGAAASLPDGSAPGPEYTIKGSSGSMLFHPPDSPYYRRTKAEIWFRTVDDARAAGFSERAAKQRTDS
jgi:hypothetical protein